MLDLGPVPGAEQEARVDLGHLHHPVAAGHVEAHGLVRVLADRLHGGRARCTSSSHGVVPRRTARRGAGDVGAGGVALEQPGALEGGQHPRGGRLRQAGGLLQVGEVRGASARTTVETRSAARSTARVPWAVAVAVSLTKVSSMRASRGFTTWKSASMMRLRAEPYPGQATTRLR